MWFRILLMTIWIKKSFRGFCQESRLSTRRILKMQMNLSKSEYQALLRQTFIPLLSGVFAS